MHAHRERQCYFIDYMIDGSTSITFGNLYNPPRIRSDFVFASPHLGASCDPISLGDGYD